MTKAKRRRQLELEQESVRLGVQRYEEEKKNSKETEMPPGMLLLNRSVEPMVEAINDFLESNKGGRKRAMARDFLSDMDAMEVAYITARECINKIDSEDALQTTCIKLSNKLINHREYKKFKEQMPNYLKAIEDDLDQRTAHEEHRKTVILRAKRKMGIEDTDFSEINKVHLGQSLIEMFIDATGLVKIEKPNIPRSSYLLKGTQEARDLIHEKHAECSLLSPEHLPMIVEPEDWTDPHGGGYLTADSNLKTRIIKTQHTDSIERMDENNEKLEGVYKAINNLQKTKWRINQDVFEVMKQCYEMDNGLGGLPTSEEEPLPPKPWGDISDEEFKKYKEENPDIVKRWKRKANDVYQRRIKNESKRHQLAKKIWVAKKFEDEDEIYFPWAMDWRGRLYPIPSHINPQMDDQGRSLLEFADGKKLGEDGAYWLKVHTANMWGKDKVSFDERVQWVDDNILKIENWADKPLVHKGWEEADEPWSFLACCFEIKGYVENGKDHVCNLPIHVDGSCNGLQHFSAMLRDTRGAEAVNLMPQEEPSDVYQHVADRVSKIVKNKSSKYANIWEGKVDRSIVKRPVMTTPYGVTSYGIRNQVEDKLRELDADGSYLGPEVDNVKAAKALEKWISQALDEVIEAATTAMEWFSEVAAVANEAEQPLRWETPIGFLPIQKYEKVESERIATYWGGDRIRMNIELEQEGTLNKTKARNSIAPNFVHSMDASHLMMTINRCWENDIKDLSMVHDSYATHACDIPKLNTIIRETFVDMYEQNDVLKQFYESVKRDLPVELKDELPDPPEKGDFELENVLQSLYFFA